MMNKTTRTLLLLTLLFLPAACARAQSPALAAPQVKADAPRRYETVPFESKLVGAPLPYNVILPADYKTNAAKQRRYPVLYLLHGLSGSADNWVSERAHLADYAAPYP